MRHRGRGGVFVGIFGTAAGTLLLEVALTRVLSFTIWYHFAYVILSAALLGFGAAGTFVAVVPSVGARRPAETLAKLALGGAGAAAALLALVVLVPLNPMRVGSEAAEALSFASYIVGAAVPFFLAGLVVSIVLRDHAEHVHRLYAADLVGASVGCALAVPAMNAVSPPGVVLLACAAFAGSAVAFSGVGRRRVAAAGAAVLLIALSPFAVEFPFTPAKSKHLPQHLEKQAMEPVLMRWSALFRTDVVRATDATPFSIDHEWGVSRSPVPKLQAPWGAITHDGSAGTHIYDLREGMLAHVDRHVLDLPYRIVTDHPNVLVIGVGGGRDLVTALRHEGTVTGVELDPNTVEILRDELGALHDGRFRPPGVTLVAGEGRHFAATTADRYDVIQITGVDTLAATTSGAYVLAENYLYTVEAFERYLALLKPGGVLSIGTGIANPGDPVIGTRFVAVAAEALRRRGAAKPWRHILFVHSGFMLADLMVSATPFPIEHVERIRAASLDLGFVPFFAAGEGLRKLRILTGGSNAGREHLYRSDPYRIRPTTDDSPFFFQFHRWGSLLTAREYGPMHSSALGQIVLLMLLGALSLLAVVFVVGPLVLGRRGALARLGAPARPVLLYFGCLGAGFMLFEVSLIQRMLVYLGYPTYALSVVFFALLTFLGVGSFVSERWVGRERRFLSAALLVLVLLVAFYSFGLPVVQDATLSASLAVRVGVTVLTLAPLGMLLGAFLPLGVRWAASVGPDLVPWAWAANGCASVSATVLSVILAMSFGFRFVWSVSLGVYAVGVATFLWSHRQPRSVPGVSKEAGQGAIDEAAPVSAPS